MAVGSDRRGYGYRQVREELEWYWDCKARVDRHSGGLKWKDRTTGYIYDT